LSGIYIWYHTPLKPQVKSGGKKMANVSGWKFLWALVLEAAVVALVGCAARSASTGADYNRAFFDPQNKADLRKVVIAPSPIDDPTGFARWQDGYLAAIHEKLNTYTGPSIDGGGKCGTDFGSNRFIFVTSNWPVIASYKFTWNEQEILTKTVVLKDSQGVLIPVSITYTTPDSPAFDSIMGFKTPPAGFSGVWYVYFAWTDYNKRFYTDKFIESFMPTSDTNFEAQRRVWAGTGSDVDRDLVARSRFINEGIGED
jgi:hypothetical protein